MPHIHEKIDFTSEVFVVFENKVLLRKHDKYGIWLSVGGHIELEDDPNEAAVREVKEEVGLDVELYIPEEINMSNNTADRRELIPPAFMNRHRINEMHEHVTMSFFAKSDTDKIVQQEDEQSDEIKWFTKEELEDLEGLNKDTKQYALKALEVYS